MNMTPILSPNSNRKTAAKNLLRKAPHLVLGGGLLVAGSAWAFNQLVAGTDNLKSPKVHLEVADRPVARDGQQPASFSPVVKKVVPSVARVFTSAKPKRTDFRSGPRPDLFRRFFGEEPYPFGPEGLSRMPRRHGVGSGVIVSRDGYLLTNNHVIDGADEVQVALSDGREFTARVVGRDPKTDVAVLKVDAHGLPAIALADSDTIEVGDLVLAVGNPFGIGQTVTMGMVSAKGRGNVGLDYEDFIQTDAAINPGNSGGALVDVEGRLVGINTAILSESGGNQGIGFAIPVNLARQVMDSLVQDGRVTRGYMGVLIQDLTPRMAAQFRLTEPQGTLVGDVTPNGPADKAGIKSGDVITHFNGKAVRDTRQLKLMVAQAKPGTVAPVKLLRDGVEKSLQVALKELPGAESLAGKSGQKESAEETLEGVTVGDLDAATRRQMGIPQHLNGALVTDVDPQSAAREAGLAPGDVIVEINRQPVKDADAAVRLTANSPDKTTLLRVWRDGSRRYIVVDESKSNG